MLKCKLLAYLKMVDIQEKPEKKGRGKDRVGCFCLWYGTPFHSGELFFSPILCLLCLSQSKMTQTEVPLKWIKKTFVSFITSYLSVHHRWSKKEFETKLWLQSKQLEQQLHSDTFYCVFESFYLIFLETKWPLIWCLLEGHWYEYIDKEWGWGCRPAVVIYFRREGIFVAASIFYFT